MSYQSSRYCFTLNNFTEEQRSPPEWIKGITTGGVWGREIGDNGTPHIQGFMALKKKSTITGIRKHFPEGFSMHMEACKGNAQQNIDYCTKGEDYETWGDLPTDTKRKYDNSEKEDLGQAYKLIKEGRQEEIQPYIRLKYAVNIDKVASKVKHVVQHLDKPCGLWIWGVSGAGKSTMARSFGNDVYDKPLNPWWDGYDGESIVLLDDVHPHHGRSLETNLKRWADKFTFIGMVKGSTTGVIRPKRIIVTSQYSIEQIFGERKTWESISRRFEVIYMPSKWEEPQEILQDVESDIQFLETDEEIVMGIC